MSTKSTDMTEPIAPELQGILDADGLAAIQMDFGGGRAVDTVSGLGILGALPPSSVEAGESFTLRVTVVPGSNPASTGLVVVANLLPIGGVADQPLYDDGTHGDSLAGDRIFSLSTSVAANGCLAARASAAGVRTS